MPKHGFPSSGRNTEKSGWTWCPDLRLTAHSPWLLYWPLPHISMAEATGSDPLSVMIVACRPMPEVWPGT